MKNIINHIIGWDIRNWSRFLIFSEKYINHIGPGKKALEIGARHGGLSLYLALKGFTVICSDLTSPEPTAKIIHDQYGVTERVKYEVVNALNIPYDDNSFDLVMFKSVLVNMENQENQKKAMNEIYRILKPNGVLLFAENLKGSQLHQYLRKRFVNQYLLSQRKYLSIEDIDDLGASFHTVIKETYGFLGLLGWNETIRNILGILDGCIDRVSPAAWRYIIFVYCKK